MPRTIWITRHGERIDMVDSNWIKTAQFKDDPHLTEKGIIQAKDLAKFFVDTNKDTKIDHVVASPFQRCVNTANFSAEALGLPLALEPAICEHLWLFPPGYMTADQLNKQWASVDVSYIPLWQPKTRETNFDDTATRISELAPALAKRFPGNVVFVAHGATCTGLTYGLTGKLGYQGLCTITKVVQKDESSKWEVEMIGATDHLSDKSDLKAWCAEMGRFTPKP